MTAIPQATAIDGYRWLKNDIIRGVYHPDEKLRMSLLTSRYGLGVGPLREALSQLVAERLVTVVNQKGYRVAPMSEQELLDIFDARANMEAMLVRLAIERGGDEWEAELLARAHLLNKHNLRPPGADCLHSSGVERGFRDARKITSLTPKTEVLSVTPSGRLLTV